jgi:hypothetical protein
MVLIVFYAIIISVAAKHNKRAEEERTSLSFVSQVMEPVIVTQTAVNVSFKQNNFKIVSINTT